MGLIAVSARGETSSSDSTRIGNFYYLAPSGIAFIKNDAAAFVINPGGPHDAGTGAPDDSFHKVIFSPSVVKPGQEVEFQWSRQGNAIIGRIISEKPGEMTFRLGENWPGFSSLYSADGNGVKGTATLGWGNDVAWRLQTQPAPKSADGTQFTITLGGPSQPTYLVAGFGDLPAFDGIDGLLAAAEKKYADRRPQARGPTGDILGAIADNMNNSRIYSSDNKMVAISVSRTFGVNSTSTANTCPYFCWDSFFSALLASLDDPEMGHQTVRAILSSQSPEGAVPNYTHWSRDGTSRDRFSTAGGGPLRLEDESVLACPRLSEGGLPEAGALARLVDEGTQRKERRPARMGQ